MKKIIIMLIMTVMFMSCTKNGKNVTKPIETADLYGTWVYKQGNIETFLTSDKNAVSNVLKFGTNGYFAENTTYLVKDSIYTGKDTVIYGNWKLQNDSLIIMSLIYTDTVIRKICWKDRYFKIGNTKYLNDTINTYASDIIGSWYQLGSTDYSFYQFNDNSIMNHYYQPVTPTVQDDYTWSINKNILFTRLASDTIENYEDIKYINERYGNWGGHFYQKSR